MPLLFESGRMDSMPKKIEPALRQRAVRLVLEHRTEYRQLTKWSAPLGVKTVRTNSEGATRFVTPPGPSTPEASGAWPQKGSTGAEG